MKERFKIRHAHKDDKAKVKELFAHSIANRKNLVSHDVVESNFLNEFVNKTIDQGDMIVVENHDNELELIGEIHYYHTRNTGTHEEYFREITFFSRLERRNDENDSDLIEWLHGEIEKKHKDVFSVEITTPITQKSRVESYQKKGILVEGNYMGRLKEENSTFKTLIPLSWINPSFN